MNAIAPLRDFVQSFTNLVDTVGADEVRVLKEGEALLARLVGRDDWLPAQFAQPSAESYRQNLLYCDPRERFSLVSFVWGPGQSTPVHDHTVWGMIGMLRGAETCEEFECERLGSPLRAGERHVLKPGEIDKVSPRIGDIHRVANALAERPSISIHIYGANIGAVNRHVFDGIEGKYRAFVSGYSNPIVPNLWDRSDEVRAALAG
jgi:predicted metal-dependent enzyme (double-stranded beta helix superfamily)